jgi:hypothetical protein
MAFTDFVDPKTGKFVVSALFSEDIRKKIRLGHEADDAETRGRISAAKNKETQGKLDLHLKAGEASRDKSPEAQRQVAQVLADAAGTSKAADLKKQKKGGLFGQLEAGKAAADVTWMAGLAPDQIEGRESKNAAARDSLQDQGVPPELTALLTGAQLGKQAAESASGEVKKDQAVAQKKENIPNEAELNQIKLDQEVAAEKTLMVEKLAMEKETLDHRAKIATNAFNQRIQGETLLKLIGSALAPIESNELIETQAEHEAFGNTVPAEFKVVKQKVNLTPMQAQKAVQDAIALNASIWAKKGEGFNAENLPAQRRINSHIRESKGLIEGGFITKEQALVLGLSKEFGPRVAMQLPRDDPKFRTSDGELNVDFVAKSVGARLRLAKQLSEVDERFAMIFRNEVAGVNFIKGLLTDAGVKPSEMGTIGPLVVQEMRELGID